MRYVDMTPSWTEILPTILVLLREGNEQGKATARSELIKMAGLADEAVRLLKD